MEDVALHAPMVGFVAGAIVDKAQLDFAEVSGAGGGATGLAGLDHNGPIFAQSIAAIGKSSSFITRPPEPKCPSPSWNTNGRRQVAAAMTETWRY